MDHADGGLIVLVLQIRVELPQLLDQKHALIHDGAAGQAAHVGLLTGLLEHPANHIQPPVKGDTSGHSRRLSHKRLPDAGHTVPCLLPQILGAYRHLPPAKEGQPLLLADDLKQLLCLIALQLFLREEEHANAVFPLRAQRDARSRGGLCKEFMADLQQDAHAIAGFSLSILPCPVFQMLHDLQRVIQRPVAFASLDIHDRADAAVVVFKPGIVQPGRCCAFGEIFHSFFSFGLQKINGVSAQRAKMPSAGTPLFSGVMIAQRETLYKAEEILFSSGIFVPFAQNPAKSRRKNRGGLGKFTFDCLSAFPA